MLIFRIVLVGCIAGGCLPAVNSGDPPRREEEVTLRMVDNDRDGNDSWELASTLKMPPGLGVILRGSLGEVDANGVFDQVDYYRFQARHTSLLIATADNVAVSVVTADDQAVRSKGSLGLLFTGLSEQGGYALRIVSQDDSRTGYSITLAAGGQVRDTCANACRYGLSCVDDRCLQQSTTVCSVSGDCSAGACLEGVCQLGEGESCSGGGGQHQHECRSCSSNEQCLYGICDYGVCLMPDHSCEPVGVMSSRCRGGHMQLCSASSWHNVGRCDTGCLDDRCAPVPDSCDVEGATLCLDHSEAVCRDGEWAPQGLSGACHSPVALEGDPCQSSNDCQQPFTCLKTEYQGSDGVCAMPCDAIGDPCHDNKTCSATLQGLLFCLDTSSAGSCDLSELRGCRGEVGGACLDGSCWRGCTFDSCPGSGCACGSNQECAIFDNSSQIGSVLGICASFAQVDQACNDELLCAGESICLRNGEDSADGYCRELCQNSSCSGGKTCIRLDNTTAVCMPTAGVGQACHPVAVCEEDGICVADSSTAETGTCRLSCQDSCPDGELCTELSSGTSACLP